MRRIAPMVLSGGTLRAGVAGALPDGTAYAVNGGALDLNSFDLTMSSLSGTGGEIRLGTNGLTVDQAGDTSFAGKITGTAGNIPSFTKTGAGTLTLTGAGSSFNGASYVSGGILAVAGGGGVSSAFSYIGYDAGSSGKLTVDGAGSTWTSSNDLYVGGNGTGTLTISNKGSVSSLYGIIGSGADGIGTVTVTVDGEDSAWTNSSSLVVGYAGAGTLTISNGGGVRTPTIYIAANSGSSGTLNIGADAGDPAVAPGTLAGNVVLGDGAVLNFNHNATAAEPYNFTTRLSTSGITGSGKVTVTAGYTALTADADDSSFYGNTRINGGTLAVDTMLGGTVDVANGGTLTGSGGIWNVVNVASGGTLAGTSGTTLTTASLTMDAGAIVSVALGAPSATGLFHVAGDLTLDGTLNVTARPGFGDGLYRLFDYEGDLTDHVLGIGTTPAGGTLTVQTSVANQVNLLASGYSSSGGTGGDGTGGGGTGGGGETGDGGTSGPAELPASFNFWNGTASGSGTWGAAAANWADADGVTGLYNPGALLIFDHAGGIVTADGALAVDRGVQFAGDGYTVAGGALVLGGPRVAFRVGDGSVEGAGYVATIGAALTGTGGIEKTDLGTLILTGANDYTGDTLVSGGALVVNGSLTRSAVTVASAARLGGNGTIAGLVAQAGGVVAPGDAGSTLHVAGDVTLAAGSVYSVAVDASGA